MRRFVLLFSLIICSLVTCKRRQHKEKDSSDSSDFGGKLVSDLKNDANIDLSADEEYEDLRAELLAYHTALASLTSRRSMKTTPCWKLGGICIDSKMCQGNHFMTEVAGCRDKLEVCCFTWNKYQVRDMRDKGVGLPMPWSQTRDFGGKGVIDSPDKELETKMKPKAGEESDNMYSDKSSEDSPVVVILRRKKKT